MRRRSRSSGGSSRWRASTADHEQILAFRLARSGLTGQRPRTAAEAAACPASDFHRDAALLALSARLAGLTREAYDEAVDSGELVLAHVVRGAIHALDPADFALYGRALLPRDGASWGYDSDGLAEVAPVIEEALGAGPLDKRELHQAMRERLPERLLPWCRGCRSHHVAPSLWRFATIAVGARLDSRRRYLLGKPGRPRRASEAVLGFLRFYGPGSPGEFAEWAGMPKAHARELWDEVAGEIDEDGLLREDAAAFDAPPAPQGVFLLPPGDPFLQKPNRELLAPDPVLRKRLFRPVASPGVVLKDGRVGGLWRARGSEISVEPLGRLTKAELADEVARVAALRGGGALVLS